MSWTARIKVIIDGGRLRAKECQVIEQCARVADRAVLATQEERDAKAAEKGTRDFTPLWSSALLGGYRPIVRPGRLNCKDTIEMLNHCAEVADWVEENLPPIEQHGMLFV